MRRAVRSVEPKQAALFVGAAWLGLVSGDSTLLAWDTALRRTNEDPARPALTA